MLWKWLLLLVGTADLLYISRASLRSPRTHGFFRLFAWEAILLLFLLNVDYWFVRPFAWYQVISWVLLIVCILPLVWGVILLKRRGEPAHQRPGDPNLMAFEKTTRLVTSGIYRYIRHPLYSSLLLLAWGIFFKHPSLVGGALAAAATVFLFLTARADEAECLQFFGDEYAVYMKTSRRFIPFLF